MSDKEEKGHKWLDAYFRPVVLSLLTAMLLGGGGFVTKYVVDMNERIEVNEGRSLSSPEIARKTETFMSNIPTNDELKKLMTSWDSVYVSKKEFIQYQESISTRNWSNTMNQSDQARFNNKIERLLEELISKMGSLESEVKKQKK